VGVDISGRFSTHGGVLRANSSVERLSKYPCRNWSYSRVFEL